MPDWGYVHNELRRKSLRTWMTGLLAKPYTASQANYDLARLSRNQLTSRRPHANTCDLTSDGQPFAVVYTKVQDHVLYPLMADQHITTRRKSAVPWPPSTGTSPASPQRPASAGDLNSRPDSMLRPFET